MYHLQSVFLTPFSLSFVNSGAGLAFSFFIFLRSSHFSCVSQLWVTWFHSFFFALWTPCAKSVGVAGSQFVCVCVCGVWAHGSSSSTFAVVNQQLNKKRKRKQNKTKSTLLQIEAWFGNVPRPFRPHRKLLLAEWLADCRKRRNLGTGRCRQGRVNFFFAETSFWTTLRVKNLVLI